MATSECPPLADRVTKSLLGYGVIAGPCYVLVAAVQAATRDGFDPTRHAVSQLANGSVGWIQVANFLVTGAMTVAAAVGIGRALRPDPRSRWAAALLTCYGVGLIAAGLLRADPSDGFPPGTPSGAGQVSGHGIGHLVAGGLGFLGLVAAGFVIGAALQAAGSTTWAHCSRLVAGFFAAAFVVMASGTAGAAGMLLFTAAVVVSWAWLSITSVLLYRRVGAPATAATAG
ncbi:DUF998 domain-containing protein [Mycobacterium sp. MYCO198283]|uniref:DUF998 domain-containing protein n=1 Tax=Mycobacterium sp. MYCO198283 TaxID=2883505 RepID=UPI001E4BB9F3|nr:DUF998 domain-containing protein [Mycobacterium sp. MYCO198283]MCG5431133.1 DUF998 domain-containing protein [Mycobacterium sp. MYCO198283]